MSASGICFLHTVRFKIENLDPVSIQILRAAAVTAPKTYGHVIMVTSANDSRHSDNSLHYVGRAYDIRTQPLPSGAPRPGCVLADTPEQRDTAITFWCNRMRRLLGNDYDVINERDHVHIEHDPRPKGGKRWVT